MEPSKVVLLIDDSETDVFFFQQSMEKTEVSFPLEVISDGAMAVSYLSGQEPYSDRSRYPLPALVLLDLKLPRKSGLEILEWIRGERALREIRVVVLTSSSEAADIAKAYALGATFYIVKPMSMEKLRLLVRAIKSYWDNLDGDPSKPLWEFVTPRPKAV